MHKFTIPGGWEKGEPVTVSKRKAHGSLAWFIERPFKIHSERKPERDEIAFIFFHSLEEFTEFMKWWFGA